MGIFIEPARSGDLASIMTLIQASHLPIDGLAEHMQTALVARLGKQVVGCAALELYGEFALLRSVVVDQRMRGQRLGGRLMVSALELARQHGVRSVYLLTETAGEYFPRFGFKRIERADVPEAVQTSVEFTTACPAGAIAMMLRLQAVSP